MTSTLRPQPLRSDFAGWPRAAGRSLDKNGPPRVRGPLFAEPTVQHNVWARGLPDARRRTPGDRHRQHRLVVLAKAGHLYRRHCEMLGLALEENRKKTRLRTAG